MTYLSQSWFPHAPLHSVPIPAPFSDNQRCIFSTCSFCFPGISYTQNHIVCNFLCLTSFRSMTWQWDLYIISLCGLIVHSFYCWIIFHCIDILLFVYLLVDGHLGSLQFLAVMNIAIMSIHIKVLVWTYFFISWVDAWKWYWWACW